MAVTVALRLYEELGSDAESVDARRLRVLVEDRRDYLRVVGNVAGTLLADGWDATLIEHDLVFSHPEVNTEEEARERLDRVGLDDRKFLIGDDNFDPVIYEG